MNPLISIIIPTFNRAHLIEETINSIVNQSYSNWECLIVDDGSSDNIKQVLGRYIKADNRFKFFDRPSKLKKGPCSCRNFGLQISRGSFIQWLDSDDLLHENKLLTDLKYLDSAEYDYTISQSDFFDGKTKIKTRVWNTNLYSNDPLNDFILKEIGWGINSPLWRKSKLLEKQLNFNENLQNSNDFFYHIEAIIKGFKPVIIYETLVSQRDHEERIMNNSDKTKAKAFVNMYLLENAESLQLKTKVINFQKKQSIKILSAIYKKRKLKEALKFSLQILKLDSPYRITKEVFRLFFAGVNYNIFKKGYKWL